MTDNKKGKKRLSSGILKPKIHALNTEDKKIEKKKIQISNDLLKKNSNTMRNKFIDFQESIYRKIMADTENNKKIKEYYDYCSRSFDTIKKVHEDSIQMYERALKLEDQLKKADKKGFYSLKTRFEQLKREKVTLEEKYRKLDDYFYRAKENRKNTTFFGVSVNLYEYFFQLRDYVWKSENEVIYSIYSVIEKLNEKGYSTGEFSVSTQD